MALRKKAPAETIRVPESVKNLEYNTQRKNLIISEYGRNVEKMVEYAMSIEDREKRNKVAQSIVTAMAMLNPQVREIADYRHKLWDHLFIISDFKLDVDCPFPKPEREVVLAKPQRIPYPKSDTRYKYYGKILESMIRRCGEVSDEAGKEQLTKNLANFMKMSYLTWNKDTVDDSTIFKHLEELSNGKLKMDETKRLNHTAEILAISKEKQRENTIRQVKNNNGRKNNNNNNNKNNNNRRKK